MQNHIDESGLLHWDGAQPKLNLEVYSSWEGIRVFIETMFIRTQQALSFSDSYH
jgi:hypothetical protein